MPNGKCKSCVPEVLSAFVTDADNTDTTRRSIINDVSNDHRFDDSSEVNSYSDSWSMPTTEGERMDDEGKVDEAMISNLLHQLNDFEFREFFDDTYINDLVHRYKDIDVIMKTLCGDLERMLENEEGYQRSATD